MDKDTIKREANEKAAQQRLQHDIYQCASTLISELQKAHGNGEFQECCEEFMQLGSVECLNEPVCRLYDDPAHEVLRVYRLEEIPDDDQDGDEVVTIEYAELEAQDIDVSTQLDVDTVGDIVKAHPDYPAGLNLLEEDEAPETDTQDVLEHWLVSNYAADELRSVGEQVVEILGLNIWCRCTSGQSMLMDSCMQQLGKRYLEEQKNYGG